MYFVPFIIISSLCLTACLGISSKLDFGDDSGASIITTHQNNIPIRRQDDYEIIRKEPPKTDETGLICNKGGCNSTKTKNDAEEVKTDVVIQVKTSINAKNSTKFEDVPDVPVVLGTNGAGFKNIQGYHRSGLHYHQAPPKHFNDRNSPPLVVTNIEDILPTNVGKLTPANLYNSKNDNDIDMHIKFSPNLPMITFSLPDGYQYKTEGVEVKVPYFETSYHKHYFGESSPPQVAYHIPKGNVLNPVAFNNVARPAYSFTNWQHRIPSVQRNQHEYHYGENCNCPTTIAKHNIGLHWYPSNKNNNNNVPAMVPIARSNVYGNNKGVFGNIDPGSQINDKLAPLN